MNLKKMIEADYYRIEFIHAVIIVYSQVDMSLKEVFLLCYENAKKNRIKTDMSPVYENAYQQFRYLIRKYKINTKIKS